MAIVKEFQKSSLIIEVENGTNDHGTIVYKRKSFSGVKEEATPEAIHAVAEAIKTVLKKRTRDCLINNVSLITNSEEE